MNFRNVLFGIAIGASLAATSLAQSGAPLPVTVAGCPTGPVPAGTPLSITFTGPSTIPYGGTGGAYWTANGNNIPNLTMTPAAGDTQSVTLSGPASAGTVEADLFYSSLEEFGSGTCAITIEIPPVQIIGSCPTTSYLPGSAVDIPLQATGGSGSYTWTITSSTYTLTNPTGPTTAVTGTAQSATTTFTVMLFDTSYFGSGYGSGTSTPATLSCSISPPAPLYISGTCPASPIAVGTPVGFFLNAVGGVGNYAWTISPSNGPLTLSATGPTTFVQGTFNTAGPQSFIVSLFDPTNPSFGTATFQCTIQVTPVQTAPGVQINGTCPAAPIVTGQSFSLPLTATGGTAPYNWAVTGPFSASATSGSAITLSGTPTTPGTVTVTATVHDSTSEVPGTATISCTIRVVAPLTITGPACPLPTVPAATAFNFPLTGAGGTGNYTWTVTGPSFLSLTTATGATTALFGAAPTAGTYPFTVTLADDAKTPLTAPYACSLQISNTLAFPPATLPVGTVNVAYPQTQLIATGGATPLTFTLSNGTKLPPGLQLSTTGVISGTPTQTGTFSFTVTAADAGTGSNQQTQNANFQIQVIGPLVNTTACPLPTGQEGQSYNAPLTATGGTGQYTFALTNNSLLPVGLVLNQNSIIGTPQGPSDTVLNFQLTSGPATPVKFSCELVVMGRIPTVTVNGFFTSNSGPIATSTVSVDAPVQQDVTGVATLTFTPNVPNKSITDNPQVQFCNGPAEDQTACSNTQKDAAGLVRIAPFTIPAGTTDINLPPLLMSNVAGTIQIALTNLSVGGQAFTAAPLTFTIAPAAPQIISGPTATWSGKSLQLSMTASSNTCELKLATVLFTAASGTQFSGGGSTLTSMVPLQDLFSSFTPSAVDSTHTIGGCSFVLNLPFTISGGQSSIQTISVSLTSSAGSSLPGTVGIQP